MNKLVFEKAINDGPPLSSEEKEFCVGTYNFFIYNCYSYSLNFNSTEASLSFIPSIFMMLSFTLYEMMNPNPFCLLFFISFYYFSSFSAYFPKLAISDSTRFQVSSKWSSSQCIELSRSTLHFYVFLFFFAYYHFPEQLRVNALVRPKHDRCSVRCSHHFMLSWLHVPGSGHGLGRASARLPPNWISLISWFT